MGNQFFFQYGGYELHCKPREAPHGRYRAQLRIVHASDAKPSEQNIDLDAVPSFETAGEAGDHARVIGQRWVDKHGGPRA